MLADFTALGADPLLVDPSELRDVPVVATAVGGVVRYRSEA
jgi:predicted amidohydrolase YtcJ